MTTAMLERRVMKLEAEIRQIKRVMPVSPRIPHIDTTSASFKKLPRGVQAGLRDIVAGRVSGPFNTIEELIADLES
jgi:capsule polysaccharide export protein KpsE/RkpR